MSIRIGVAEFIPATLFQTIASRTSAAKCGKGERVDALFMKKLALVGVCVNRIGKVHSTH
jgi:hypothetical protein